MRPGGVMKSKLTRLVLNVIAKIDSLVQNLAGNGMFPEFIKGSGFTASEVLSNVTGVFAGIKIELEKGIGSDGEYAGSVSPGDIEGYLDDVRDLTDEFGDQIIAFVRSSPSTFVERFAELLGTKSHEALTPLFSTQIRLFRENISEENLNADRAVQCFLTMNATMAYIENRATQEEVSRETEMHRLARLAQKFGAMPVSNIPIASNNANRITTHGGRSAEKRERDRQVRAASKQPKGAKPQVHRKMQSV
jgi:hypothetical protein